MPQRGAKTGIVEHATQNAREALARRLAESSSQRTLLEGCRSASAWPRTPRRIEVFDNSHIQGTNAVGAMIVAGPDGFVKNQYRKFNIKSADLTPGDDYAMMREVLTRRFKRLVLDEAEAPVAVVRPCGSDTIAATPTSRQVSDPQGLTPARASSSRSRRRSTGAAAARWRSASCAPMPTSGRRRCRETEVATPSRPTRRRSEEADAASDEFPARPDLVLIDGGRGQLGVAREVLRELGIDDVPLIGVAKGPDRDAGREHFHLPGRDSR